MREIVWSYGGGVQSVAIACLLYENRLPLPHRIVMADTGYEFGRVWEFTRNCVVPLLALKGLKIEIAPHDLSTVDLYSLKGECLLPAFSVEHGSKLPAFCSSEWKRNVVRRYIGGAKAYPDGIEMWIGMSLDELGRLKTSDVKWIKNHYPLCFDVKMRRNECKDLIDRIGLPLPPKSRCLMCSHQGDDEWMEIQVCPDEWEKAIAIDEQIFLSHGLRLHKSGLPLSQVRLIPTGKDTREPLFSCESGHCWM